MGECLRGIRRLHRCLVVAVVVYYDDAKRSAVLLAQEGLYACRNVFGFIAGRDNGDNGWPFPRCKANLYDGGTRQPLAVRWPAKIKPGQVCDDFINLMDLAPTFLEAAGLKPLAEMTGRSFLGLLTGEETPGILVSSERRRNATCSSRLATPPYLRK